MKKRCITLSEQLASIGEKVPYKVKQEFIREQILYHIANIIDNSKCHALCLDDFGDRATLLKLLDEGI
jgi:hypothetical protein